MTGRKTASARIIEAAENTKSVVDSAGRKITIRKLDLMDEMNLLSLVDAADSEKQTYMTVASLIYSVIDIDGIPFPPVTSKPEFEAMVKRVDRHGIKAIGPAYVELAKEEAEQAFEAAKNL